MQEMGRPHFLLLPFVEQGHINPMLCLASQLAAIDCKITFVNATPQALAGATSISQQQQQQQHDCSSYGSSDGAHNFFMEEDDFLGDRLQFVTLSPTPTSAPARCAPCKQFEHVSMSSRHMVFRQKIAALEAQQALIEKIMVDSKTSPWPISCILCDIFLWKWVHKVAVKRDVQLSLLVTSSALSFFVNHAPQIGKGTEMEELLVGKFNLPGKDDARRLGLFSIRDSVDVKMQKRKYFAGLMEGIEHAGAHFVVNSCKHLEEPLLPLIEAAGVKMTFIGGLGADRDSNMQTASLGNRRAQRAGSVLMVQDEECIMQWLDGKQRGSVLLVSFGSEGVLEAEQVDEIAMGIDKSGCCFLWVVRPDTPASGRPAHAFRQRCNRQGKGMFVSWAPQRAVLQHAAVGVFLTHSGWNSTLESLSNGVPMLCLPLIADQPLNANLVHLYWQMGLRLPQHEAAAPDGLHNSILVRRGDVERGVRALMQQQQQHKATHFQRAAQLAVQEAQHNLTSFVQSMET